MSTFARLTKHPDTGKFEKAIWHDDYFGHHLYGVEFEDGTVINPSIVTLETRAWPSHTAPEKSLPTFKQSEPRAFDMSQLRVIGVPWHTAHQYELAKLFKQYDLLMNFYRQWGDVSRPRPHNMGEVIEFDPKEYDLAILHIDQQCIDPRIGKGLLFREFKELTEGMKRVVINHMTPFHDQKENDEVIAEIKDMVGDIPMVVNSRQAAAQWGWGTPIIHGMDSIDWKDSPKEPRAVACISTGGMNKAYRRELLHATINLLEERGVELIWIQATKKFQTFEEYRDYLGRSLVFVHLAWQSPMPRSRTEAMLSGCCVVSTRHHDWGDYIVDENGKSYSELYPEDIDTRPVFKGVNGFIVPDNPEVAANLIEDLITNRIQEAREIGKRGRETALKTFSHERWAADWHSFLESSVYV